MSLNWGIIKTYKIVVPAMLVTSWDVFDSHRRANDMTDHTPQKRCTQCGESKSITAEYYTRTKSTRDGFHTQCKVCKQANNRAWRAANTTRSMRAAVKHTLNALREEKRTVRSGAPLTEKAS